MRTTFRKFDPAVDRKFLILLSGILWSVVGIMLCRLAVHWLSQVNGQNAVGPGATGLVLAFLIYHFGFTKLVHKNIGRILSKEGKVCIFAFQPWKSYLTILIMIGMGAGLRHSPVPKPWLAVVYIGFGGAMLLSSLVYYRNFFKEIA
ncbi:MAG: hypothetical protein C4560_11190 [Nitrospiraceae bacterium]|nr:MAG: hypothetical protein C4560_11190 [Nitrospiraceae bacterium]